MEELLRIIFEGFPEKSTIIFKEKCSVCGGAVIIARILDRFDYVAILTFDSLQQGVS